MLWETIKNQIRGTTIQYSSEKSKTYLNKIKTLENNLYVLESKFQENPSEVLHNNIFEVKTELEQELEKKTKGALVRSRARWYEEGERSSKYFLGMEKRNYSNKCINRIKLDDESITADRKQIIEQVNRFYKKLYTTVQPETNNEKFFNIASPKLSEEAKLKC